ncbi:uncharacterized protein LOC132639742 [Lycium barbarum]|uniref:uncharacterized protein LOC132639742 n=1 Tax=Lycium barbarum TaxID=112863 RepID=UPI00293EF18A|nr:uncharacterized protein LOC132639742 [Lycium barbarum]
MALYISTFTNLAVAIPSKIPIQPKHCLQLHFPKPISRKHLSVPHSAIHPEKYVYPDPIPEFAVAAHITTGRNRIRNEVIRDKVVMAPMVDKMREGRLRWFSHVQRRCADAPVKRGLLETTSLPSKEGGKVCVQFTLSRPHIVGFNWETRKFRAELLKKLSKEEETFGDELDDVVSVCAEIFNEFLHKEYGGPGTLLVEPFTDMMVAVKERKLPGAASAARASLLWAQNYVDQDWETWNSKQLK